MKTILTYAEKSGRNSFNWNTFLALQDIRESEWSEASSCSGFWVTCACGNLCATIPREEDRYGEPKDGLLRILGMEFHDAIKSKDRELAKDILRRIELRSGQLLAKIANQLKE